MTRDAKSKNIFECPQCGGNMEINESDTIKICPYCGYREQIEESEKMKKYRIRNSTIQSIANNSHDVLNKYIEDKQRTKREKQKKDTQIIIAMLMFVICIIIVAIIMSGLE